MNSYDNALSCLSLGAYDDVTSVSWSSCSRIVAVSSSDASTRLYPLVDFANFKTFTLGGHTERVQACFFDKDSLLAITLSRNGHLAVWEPSIELD